MWLNIPDNIEDYQGFVYIIRRKDGSYAYIGQKNFWKTIKLPALKGRTKKEKEKRSKLKGNKRHQLKETDWRNYWSSNTILQEDVKRLGEDAFIREILVCCSSKSVMSYLELYCQIKLNVLFDDYYLNGIVNVRLSANSLKNFKDEVLKYKIE